MAVPYSELPLSLYAITILLLELSKVEASSVVLADSNTVAVPPLNVMGSPILSLAILLAVCIVATAPSATLSFAKPMKFSEVRFALDGL